MVLYIDRNMDCKMIDNMSVTVEGLFECFTIELVVHERRNVLASFYRAPGSDVQLFST